MKLGPRESCVIAVVYGIWQQYTALIVLNIATIVGEVSSVAVELWRSGSQGRAQDRRAGVCATAVLRYCGAVVLYYSGTVVLWYSGTVVLWHCSTVVMSYCDTVVQYCGTVTL